MSWVAIVIVVAVVYVCVVTIVLALLRAAKCGDEAPARPEAVAVRPRFVHEEPLQLTPEDAELLERLGRR